MNNSYHCDISRVSDGSFDLSAFDKDYILFFTKFKLPKTKKVKPLGSPAKRKTKWSDVFQGF